MESAGRDHCAVIGIWLIFVLDVYMVGRSVGRYINDKRSFYSTKNTTVYI